MLKLKRILQLLAAGVSQREISNKVGISRSSITVYKDRADLSGKSYQELLLMSDPDVVSLLQRKDYRPGKNARYDMLEPLLKEYSYDILQKRSTYECLWEYYTIPMHHISLSMKTLGEHLFSNSNHSQKL